MPHVVIWSFCFSRPIKHIMAKSIVIIMESLWSRTHTAHKFAQRRIRWYKTFFISEHWEHFLYERDIWFTRTQGKSTRNLIKNNVPNLRYMLYQFFSLCTSIPAPVSRDTAAIGSTIQVVWLTRSFYALITQPDLTHWGRDKMAAVFQPTYSNGFSWMKLYEFRLKFHWNLFLGVQLTIFQHWFR